MDPEQLARFTAAAQEVASFSASLPGVLEDLQRKEAEARWVLPPALALRCGSGAVLLRALCPAAAPLHTTWLLLPPQAASGSPAGGEG